jgi:hypothetical protein
MPEAVELIWGVYEAGLADGGFGPYGFFDVVKQ